MEINHLKRNPAKIHNVLKEVGDALIATKPLKIYFPETYVNNGLANISDHITILAVFGIVVDDFYAVSIADASCLTHPSIIAIVTIENVKYYEFSFNTGDKVMVNTNLVRNNKLIFKMFQEFQSKANIPWYLSPDDICALYETAKLHANANLRTDNAIIELIVMATCRQPNDKMEYFRFTPNLNKDMRPSYVPLSSVAYQATNTFTKIGGGYFNEGLTGALVNPSDTNESNESILRS